MRFLRIPAHNGAGSFYSVAPSSCLIIHICNFRLRRGRMNQDARTGLRAVNSATIINRRESLIHSLLIRSFMRASVQSFPRIDAPVRVGVRRPNLCLSRWRKIRADSSAPLVKYWNNWRNIYERLASRMYTAISNSRTELANLLSPLRARCVCNYGIFHKSPLYTIPEASREHLS